ncbi:MAG: iron-sulfur cluster assembly scaffold protein [Pyrinomonadaceae bacterium]
MSFYPPKISEYFHRPKNVGKAAGANAVGTNATFVCGAGLRFSLRIDATSKEVLDAKFQTNGCGFLIAAAEVTAEKIIGKLTTELHALDKNNLQAEIENALGKFPERRAHCLNLTVETLQNTFADFRVRQVEEFAGEKALICSCFGVSEEAVENAIKENALETVEAVTDFCNAGGGCGSCQPLIEDILDVYRREKF